MNKQRAPAEISRAGMRDWLRRWPAYLRSGDYLVLGIAAIACAGLAATFWQGGAGEKAQVRADGRLVAEVDLAAHKMLTVAGPLGDTVIAIEAGRARVVSDPGPRQYCVRQGWLTRAGDVAICAPNRVTLQIAGRGSAFDSTAY